jgi:alpha-tubulin suppressor-like RCC1 family protein
MSAGTMTASRSVLRRPVVVGALVSLTAGLGCLVPAPRAALAASQQGAWVSAGSNLSCAIDSGRAYCWGSNPDGLGDGSTPPYSYVPVAVDTSGVLAGKTLTKISAGYGYACALDSAGTAFCWGGNYYGELGNGTTTSSNVPVAVDTSGVLAGKTLVQIAAGQQDTCALDTAGQVYCWGLNIYGQLGDGSTANSSVPVAVDTTGALAGETLTGIAASVSEDFTCAVDAAGAAYCWGINFFGQLGDSTTANSSVPVAVDTSGALAGETLTQVTVGGDQACALDNAGAAYCWGGDSDGELGDGTTALYSYVPVAVDASGVLAGKSLTQISAGTSFTCAVDTSGAAYCWGANDGGVLGDDSTSDSDVPVLVAPQAPTGVTATPSETTAAVSWTAPAWPGGGTVTGYTATAVPGAAACSTTGATACTIIGLASGTTYSVTVVADTTAGDSGSSAPVNVTPEGGGAISAGSSSCAAEYGNAFCWGSNEEGQLGDGSTADSRNPVAVTASGVLAGKTIAQITTGDDDSTCALDTAGAAFCWGRNNYGQLGDGSTAGSTVPVAVTTSGVLAGVTLTQMTAGNGHTCALDAAGAAFCWGLNTDGQLGDGHARGSSSLPQAVDISGALAGEALTQITAVGDHTCALDAKGAAFCWGLNAYGELGDGKTADSSVPVAVQTSGALAGQTLTQVGGGGDHTCALDAAGAAFCWGRGSDGQLGDGSTASSRVAVAVQTSGALAGTTLTQITAGFYTTCALDAAGAAFCWGDNDSGQLGNATTTQSDVPVAVDAKGVLAGKTLAQIGSGVHHTCALDTSGAAYCWGSNANGDLGDNTAATSSEVPVLAGPQAPTGVTAVPWDPANPDNKIILVSWNAPASLDGGTLTGYTATAVPGGAVCTTTATTCKITVLTDGLYSITVVADTTAGDSGTSTPVNGNP